LTVHKDFFISLFNSTGITKMTHSLASLLAEKKILLADGATGTNYFEMGLEAGEAPELWNTQSPEKVALLHRQFVDAGADIILSNTFGCNRNRLKLHKAENRVYELNKAAAEIARKVADKVARPVIVAGSVGPTGELFEPLGELTRDSAIQSFVEQMEGLKAGGVEVAWIETMSAREEIEAAAEAARRVGLDYVITASFDTAGKTMMGISPTDMGAIAAAMSPHPIAFGANCGVGASDLLASVLDMTKEPPCCAVVAKANCGIPRISGDKVVYSGTPELMSDFVRLAIESGAKIIGGCCGTSPGHLAAMRIAIDDYFANPPASVNRPDIEKIEGLTGALVNQTASASTGVAKRTRRGKRRG
jgi:5-methyltetrahydrofolate--homocysteine methyltransferase